MVLEGIEETKKYCKWEFEDKAFMPDAKLRLMS